MREERSSSRSAMTAPQRDEQNRSRSVPWYSLVHLCARRRKRASALCQNSVTYPPNHWVNATIHGDESNTNCVRPRNVVRSLTAILFSCRAIDFINTTAPD
jgi:hypothetical protein